MSRTVTVEVPEGADPGDSLSIVVDGVELEFPVPFGSVPGDLFEIQVGSNNEDDGDTSRSDIVNVSLPNGTTLQLSTTIATTTETSTATTNSATEYNDGTHAMAWPAGISMAQCIGELVALGSADQCPKRVLELGSGLGVVGLAFASTFASSAPPLASCHIVLTDEALPLLEWNVSQNRPTNPNVTIECQQLKWGKGNQLRDNNTIKANSFDLILLSDVLYKCDNNPHLFDTIEETLVLNGGTILLAVRWREPSLEREFFAQTSNRLGIVWNVYSSDLSWEDYDNDSSEVFRVHWTQTMVSVQGTPMALANIEEEQVEQMTHDEYQAWELAQIQMYIGTRC